MDRLNNGLIFHQENLIQSKKWRNIALLLLVTLILSIFANVNLSLKLSNQEPIVKVAVISKKGDFSVRVLEEDIPLSTKQMLIESALRQYIVDRTTNVASKKLDDNEIDSRKVQMVNAFSSKKVIDQYTNEMMKIYNESEFQQREIDILSFDKLEERKYAFNYETNDIYPSGEEVKHRWTVYIKYDLMDPNEFEVNDHKILNPLGIKITYYSPKYDRKSKSHIKESVNE